MCMKNDLNLDGFRSDLDGFKFTYASGLLDPPKLPTEESTSLSTDSLTDSLQDKG